MRLCVIPARGGSKRIPRKNIKEFCGKPMISYSIEAALSSGCFDKVVVSTDDKEIAEVAVQYGAEVPFLRPENLSGDFTATLPVIKHAIEWFSENVQKVEHICCLYATAPFVQASSISKAFKQLLETNAEYCFTVATFAFPIQRAVRKTKNNRVEMFTPEYYASRSQDLEEAYHDAGQFYWGTPEAFLLEKPFFTIESTPYILPRYLVQDIDTSEDWLQAESMYKVLKQSRSFE